jgi:hypothetical protein
MEQEKLKKLAEQASIIAKETAETLKRFSRDTAMLVYASQLLQTKIHPAFTGENASKKISNDDANKKLHKAIETAKVKWQYVSEADKKKAKEMEMVMNAGQEKIKMLYAEILKT